MIGLIALIFVFWQSPKLTKAGNAAEAEKTKAETLSEDPQLPAKPISPTEQALNSLIGNWSLDANCTTPSIIRRTAKGISFAYDSSSTSSPEIVSSAGISSDGNYIIETDSAHYTVTSEKNLKGSEERTMIMDPKGLTKKVYVQCPEA